jgi:hypothetical protein
MRMLGRGGGVNVLKVAAQYFIALVNGLQQFNEQSKSKGRLMVADLAVLKEAVIAVDFLSECAEGHRLEVQRELVQCGVLKVRCIVSSRCCWAIRALAGGQSSLLA